MFVRFSMGFRLGSLFGHFGFDAVTLSPYMGWDSIAPFVADKKKGAFILCKTSNASSKDFQNLSIENEKLFSIPSLKNTPAAKNIEVIRMDGLYMLGFGPRTASAIKELNFNLYGKNVDNY